MAPHLTARTSSLLLGFISRGAPAARLAVARPAAMRLYWSWRCARYPGDGIYPHSSSYGRLLRYRHGREHPATNDGGHPTPSSRLCNSWTKKRDHHANKSRVGNPKLKADEGKPSPKESVTSRPRRLDWELKSLMRSFLSEQDPTTWRVKVEKLLKEEPYLGIFGERRGVWNPWIRKEWRAMWNEIETDMREIKADLGFKKQSQDNTAADSQSTHGIQSPKVEPAEVAEAREGYTFDPIAMRYVKKPAAPSAAEGSTAPVKKKRMRISWAIPVAPPSAKMTDLGEGEIKALGSKSKPEKPLPIGFARQPWLSQEGDQALAGTGLNAAKSGLPNTKDTILKSSLDRMTADKSPLSADTKKPPLEDAQRQAGPKTESPVNLPVMKPRASLLNALPPRSNSSLEPKSRHALDKNFDAAQARFDQELSTVRKPSGRTSPSGPGETSQLSRTSADIEAPSTLIKQTLAETLKAVAEAKKKLQQAKNNALKWNMDREVREQKMAMESFENRPREPTISEDCPAAETKVAWPSDMSDARVKQEQKTRDKTLVKEIRQIYEDAYGTIDVKHRQPTNQPGAEAEQEASSEVTPRLAQQGTASSAATLHTEPESSGIPTEGAKVTTLAPPSPKLEPPSETRPSSGRPEKEPSRVPVTPRKPEIYKILAYNKDQDEVTVARTASSIYKDSAPVRSPSQILTHLDQPAKYFDLMETLEATGYELVAGSRRMLVYRCLRPEDADGLPEGTPFTVEARVRAAEPLRNAVDVRSATTGAAQAAAATNAMGADAVAAELAKLRRSDTGKMQSLHEQLRRLERRQRSMEKAAIGVAAQLRSLEAQLQRRSHRERAGEGPAGARAPPSRLGRVVRFLLRIPLLVVVGAATLMFTFVVLVLANYVYNVLWVSWVRGQPPWGRKWRSE